MNHQIMSGILELDLLGVDLLLSWFLVDIPSQGPTVRSDGLTLEVDEVATGPETSRADRNATTRQTSKPSDSVRSSVPATPKSQLRTPCPYGKDCYRKNPVHFQECSHPGDTDYEEEEAEEEEDRPECPYGTDCYRKNPLHRREYRHAEKPARSTRTVPRKAPKDDEDGGDGSEDDDSFINDDSEDVGDDSDYAPPDSDDSGKEDVRRLQREAKVFLQRRK
ncbi:aprataxin and PNK-like factor isoform X2 [Mastacembelus armatus]|nr:aprataxin and PNK-like factor isoform X2 [Mastacembelus armatus]